MFSGNLRRIEFGQTPAKPTQLNEFQSSQRLKYESNLQKSHPVSYIPKENVALVQKDLYDLLIPVKIKQQTDDWNTHLNLKMILQQSTQSHGQILRLELTDETNYQFLQVLDLTEQEFLGLKNEQSLHVDFATFPAKLADILQLCITGGEKVNFYVTLEQKNGESLLSVVENNEFKKLTHLALRFRSATDEILKNFLSQRLSRSIVENEELFKRTKQLTDQLQDKLWENDNLKAELRKFSEDKQAELQQTLLDEQKKYNELKEQALARESLILRENENEKRLIVERHEKVLHELQNKNTLLYQQVQELTDVKQQYLQSDRELRLRCTNQQNELNQLVKEVGDLKHTNKELDQTKFTQERQIIELRIQKEGLEKQLNDKEQFLSNKQALVDKLQSNEMKQNQILEEQVTTQKKQIEKLEARIQILSDEVVKGNQIIEKLTSERDKQKEKIKRKNDIALQQEKTVQQLQENSDKLNKYINELKREKDTYEIRNKDLEVQTGDLKAKVAESQKLLEQNAQMIQYLNKCLNDQKAAPAASTFTSVPFKSQTFTKYTNPLQEDRSFHNMTQPANNISQLSNATISNRLNF